MDYVKSKVSIIVPCHNQGVFLSEALDSVLNQTYQNWECIIINDGSTDNTETIANEYCQKDNRFRYIYQNNQGVCVARNNAIHSCSGEFILPLDGDDKIAPSLLEKSVKILEIDPKISIVYSDTELFGDELGMYNLPVFSIDRMLIDNCIQNSSLFRRSDYDMTKGYNPNMKGGLEDWDFWLSVLEYGGTVYTISEILFYYRTKKGSMRNSIDQKADHLKTRIIRNHWKLYLRRAPWVFREYVRVRENPIETLFSFLMRKIRYCTQSSMIVE